MQSLKNLAVFSSSNLPNDLIIILFAVRCHNRINKTQVRSKTNDGWHNRDLTPIEQQETRNPNTPWGEQH